MTIVVITTETRSISETQRAESRERNIINREKRETQRRHEEKSKTFVETTDEQKKIKTLYSFFGNNRQQTTI